MVSPIEVLTAEAPQAAGEGKWSVRISGGRFQCQVIVTDSTPERVQLQADRVLQGMNGKVRPASDDSIATLDAAETPDFKRGYAAALDRVRKFIDRI
ncbi:hypothetical protein [Pseudomonas sp. PS01301]|uniref:hypothetical protein n=1 Tax=Pseudomonas sp. PS01301 TaxID=2991437 RepID=UPI002499AE40|nr:hypothetical protein [Pseudomonas sp. PS01301]